MRVMTVVGTRPEIIRLSLVIAKFDQVFDHTLVYTGQNWDPNLSDIFFREMQIRRPDVELNVDVSSLGSSIAGVMLSTEDIIKKVRPEAFLVLGDTNSALSLVMAKRMRVPTYHMEAGNRCFDERVPEETNRRLIDHTADFNLVYTEHARRNLLAEGIQASRITLTGSPLYEVLTEYGSSINASDVLDRLDLESQKYFVVSSHREETVDDRARLTNLVDSLNAVAKTWDLPIIVSVHPRTQNRLRDFGLANLSPLIRMYDPFGFFDYNKLQKNALCVLSDSGSVGEESAILGFCAVTLRQNTERPEVIESAHLIKCDVSPDRVLSSIRLALNHAELGDAPWEYAVKNTSYRVASFVESTRREVDN